MHYEDVIPGSDYCYAVAPAKRIFDKAYQYCEKTNAHLILVKNHGENNQIRAMFRKAEGFAPTADQYWISYRYYRNSKSKSL